MIRKTAAFIVDKRKAFMVLFGIAFIYCIFSASRVRVNNELTDYLPESTETRQGLDIMNNEFKTFGSAKLLINNISYDEALELAERIRDTEGVSSVKFFDAGDEEYKDEELSDYYHDFAAVYTVSFDDEESAKRIQSSIAKIREIVSAYDSSVYTTIDKDDAKSLKEDMKTILIIVVLIITGVLLFTSKTYMEIVIFMAVFAMAIVLNTGTNYIFGEISFVTNAVGVVLQIALAIDYAIILFHRFMEERKLYAPKQALTEALSKAIPEILSSSLTTMAGMAALMTMQFGIGMDLGRVLLKSIVFSMISVFVFMPALIMTFEKSIMKTMHPDFVPEINIFGKAVILLRHIILIIFALAVAGGIYFSSGCPYVYDVNSIESEKQNEFLAARDEIEKHFTISNTMAVVVPKGDYQKEASLLADIEAMEDVETTLGLANIEVDDAGEHVLTDRLLPRELAEIADADVDTVRMLYRFYAWKKEQYGAFLKSIDSYRIPVIDIVDFIYEQIENGGLELDGETINDIEDIHKAITDAREQLESENHSRLIFTWSKPLEGEDTFESIDEVRALAHRYYEEAYVVGESGSDYDLSLSFKKDNIKISVLTAILVGLILLLTFQSAALPFILVLAIQGSIWLNFSIPYFQNKGMFFLSYLIVSSIQMGATIDYAIVITSRYMADRETEKDMKRLIIKTLNEAFPTVFTSGSIMAASGFVIGKISSNPTIASLGMTLGTGVLISIAMVMIVLPVLLYTFDGILDKSAFSRRANREEDMA